MVKPNVPFNCFTLDLSNNKDIVQKGMNKINFYFNLLADQEIEILVEDIQLATNRQISSNRFFFSGDSIMLKNLGKFHYI